MNRVPDALAAMLAVAVAGTVSAQAWSHAVQMDAFTDKEVHVASATIDAGGDQFLLFVNCQSGERLNIGLTGTRIDPIGGETRDGTMRYRMPLRWDTKEPLDEEFMEHRGVLFLDPWMGRVLRKFLPETTDEEIRELDARSRQIFAKRLADHARLRIKFPQRQQPVVLDFPLAGAAEKLLALARGCGVSAAPEKGADAFLDANGQPYDTLARMLEDDTWLSREAQWSGDQ